MSKRTYGNVFVLPNRRLVRPAADDDFAICRKAGMDMCLCYQVNVECVLQLMMTLSGIEMQLLNLEMTDKLPMTGDCEKPMVCFGC